MEDDDITRDLLAASNALMNELDSRWQNPVDDSDRIALATAISKALLRGSQIGFHAAVRQCQASLNKALDDLPVNVTIDLAVQLEGDDEEPDPWADRYA